MTAAEELYISLKEDLRLNGATGYMRFCLRDLEITVEQNNVVGNILEEWLDKWMKEKGMPHLHNKKQEAPDFWLNPDDLERDWLEVKSFTSSPNFDIAAFMSYIKLIISKPWKLHSKYLLIKYKMHGGTVEIEDFWLKNVWEISCTSSRWPMKVQYKNKVIVNICPSVWYSNDVEYKPFECLEDFLAALEETIYKYHDTRATIAEDWSEKLCESYYKHYGQRLELPRWSDIKGKYIKANTQTRAKTQ